MSIKNAAISILMLIILGFLSIHFFYFDGVPSFKDSNETYATFTHANNMYFLNPLENSFLTDESFSSDPIDHPTTYTHNANFPRYFSYLLLTLGIDTIKWHNIILCLAATIGALIFIYKVFEDKTPALLIVLSFFVLDFMGVLQWTTNMYRVWHFFLFFGCLLGVKKDTPPLFSFIIFFLLFQLEISFAAFTSVTCFLVVMFDKLFRTGNQSLHNLVFSIIGSISSVALFVIQLVTFYGWNGFLTDLQYTYLIRNSDKIDFVTNLEVQSFYKEHNVLANAYSTPISFENFHQTVYQMINSFYTPEIIKMLGVSLLLLVIFSLFLLFKRYCHPMLKDYGAPILVIYSWALILGVVVMSIINPGYTYNAYLAHFFPMIVFPIIILLAVIPTTIGLGSKIIFRKIFHNHFQEKYIYYLMMIITASMLIPWIQASVKSYQEDWPPLSNERSKQLSTKYAGKQFITGSGHDHMIRAYTGLGPFPSSIIITKKVWLETMPLGEYYICQKHYSINVDCKKELLQMEQLGHNIVEIGTDYFIVERPKFAER